MMKTYEVQGRKVCVPGEIVKTVSAVRTLTAKKAAKKATRVPKAAKES